MGYTPEEERQRELIKSAVVEALAEHRSARTESAASPKSTARIIALWALILVVAVLLYNFLTVPPG